MCTHMPTEVSGVRQDSRARYRRLWCLALVATAAAAPAVVGVKAAAARQARAPIGVTVLSPTAGALVTSPTVRVQLRIGARVTGVQAWIGTTAVGRRFRRHGGVWSAVIPRGRLHGRVRLLVRARVGRTAGATAAVSFVFGRRSPGLLARVLGGRHGSAGGEGPFGSSGYVPVRGTVVAIATRTPVRAELFVNGRRVSDLRSRLLAVRRSWAVSPLDGLRRGRNVVKVVVWDDQGRYDVRRWVLWRRRSLPLVEAGPEERVTRVGAWTRLSGRGTRPSRPGRALVYAWRVVRKPRRARPVLRGAHGRFPQFKTDVAGVYQLALAVRERAPGGRLGAPVEDVVTVDSAPAFGEQGLYVDTTPTAVDGGAAQITIGGVPYPVSFDHLWVVLDAATLAPISSSTTPSYTPTAGTITIAAWTDESAQDGSPGHTAGWGSAVYIGTQLVAQNTTNVPQPPDSIPPVRGWLQPATNGSASWVSADMTSFATRTAGSSATTNIIRVGSHSYPGTLAPGTAYGFEVLLLGDSGEPVNPNGSPAAGAAVFSLGGSNSQIEDAQALSGMLTELRAAQQSSTTHPWVVPPTVLIQGIGPVRMPPTPLAAPEWLAVADVIGELGGNSLVFQLLNGTEDPSGGAYALVALDGATAQEASYERTHGNGVLTGVLVSSPRGHYQPLAADYSTLDPAGKDRYAFLPFLYSAPSSWNDWVRAGNNLQPATAGQNAALASIVQTALANGWIPQTALCPNAPDPLRGYYCDTVATDLTTLSQRIGTLKAPAKPNSFTRADFATAQSSIGLEIQDVANIRGAIAAYQTLFGTATTTGAVDAAQIALTIQAQLFSAAATTNVKTSGAWGAMVDLAEADPELSSVAALLAGAWALQSDIVSASSSDPALPSDVAVSQATIAAELTQDYSTASAGLNTDGDYLVSDPVKLHAGAQALSVGQYTLTGQLQTALQTYATYGARQWLWGGMLGTTYAAWHAPISQLAQNPQCISRLQNVSPFANVGPSGYWGPPLPTSGDDQWWLAVMYSAQPQAYLMRNNTGLPASITDPLFSPIDPTKTPATQVNVGAVEPYFANTYLRTYSVPIITNPNQTYGCFQKDTSAVGRRPAARRQHAGR